MKNIILIVLIFTTTACGLQKEKKITKYNVHPDLQSYVTTFSAKRAIAGNASAIKDLEAHFSDTIGTIGELGMVVGVCIRSKTTTNNGLIQEVRETPVIKINRQYWESTAEADREQLMYHELGHCILKRDHDETLITHAQPESIMYPVHLGNALYVDYYSHYINELFNPTGIVIGFSGLTFSDEAYASHASEIASNQYTEVVEDDSHYKHCVHDKEPEVITVAE